MTLAHTKDARLQNHPSPSPEHNGDDAGSPGKPNVPAMRAGIKHHCAAVRAKKAGFEFFDEFDAGTGRKVVVLIRVDHPLPDAVYDVDVIEKAALSFCGHFEAHPEAFISSKEETANKEGTRHILVLVRQD